jgi:hypothetical protein
MLARTGYFQAREGACVGPGMAGGLGCPAFGLPGGGGLLLCGQEKVPGRLCAVAGERSPPIEREGPKLIRSGSFDNVLGLWIRRYPSGCNLTEPAIEHLF